MNKWKNSNILTKDTCFCSSNKGLFILNRQLSFLLAGLLFLFFSIFMAGYFLGKKTMVENYIKDQQQAILIDQIHTNVLNSAHDTVGESEETFIIDESSTLAKIEDYVIPSEPHLEVPEQKMQYYAQLIGFGTEKAAQAFVNKLLAKNIHTEIKKRTSKTAKGHVSYWYQVVTRLYSDKNELSVLVSRICKEEKIKDAVIQVSL